MVFQALVKDLRDMLIVLFLCILTTSSHSLKISRNIRHIDLRYKEF